MTVAASIGGSPELSWFIQLWVDSFARVLAQTAPAMFASAPAGESSPIVGIAEAPPDSPQMIAQDLWILGACSGRLRGELNLRVPVGSIPRLAGILMEEVAEVASAIEPASPANPTPEQREAVVELMRQVARLVATTAKTQWGEVQLRLHTAEAAPSWPSSSTVWFRFGTDPRSVALLEMQVSAALSASLRTENIRSQAADGTIAATADEQRNGQGEEREEQKEGPGAIEKDNGKEDAKVEAEGNAKIQLDLLLDVELGVTLRFGSRSMALREILDLNPGTVIELDRQVEEPVDMLLDGRVVARGEVVVMDGNYALRVTEVGPAAGL